MNYMESLAAIRPEIAISLAALLIMALDSLVAGHRSIPWVGFIGVVVAFALLPFGAESRGVFSGLVVLDPLGTVFKAIVLGSMILVIPMSIAFRPLRGANEGEYHMLLLFFAVAAMFMVSASNLLMIYLALEMLSICGYVLTGHLKSDPRSSEAALKYFLFGALCSGVFLYGATLLYGLTGSLDLAAMGPVLDATQPMTVLALVFIMMGLGFKIAAVPFHMWCPDAYEGAPTPITALLSVASKAAGFGLLLRFLTVAFPAETIPWERFIWLLAVITMTLGNIAAVRQTNLKRLLAYSSIAQAGYVLVGIAVQTQMGLEAAIIYLIVYLFMNLGAFAVVIVVSNAIGSDEIEDCNGLSTRAPVAAACLFIFLLSLTGIPPLAGFIGKFELFRAAIDAQAWWLAVIMGINSVVAAFYYFRVVKAMYLQDAEQSEPIASAAPLRLVMAAGIVGTFVIGIWPAPLVNAIQTLPVLFG